MDPDKPEEKIIAQDFKVGDIIRVVKRYDQIPGGYGWVSEMDRWLDGRSPNYGIIKQKVNISQPGGILYKIQMRDAGTEWGVAGESMELETDINIITEVSEWLLSE